MKIAVFGDSHGKLQYIDEAMKTLEEIELVIHTGDYFSDLEYIQRKYNIKALGVRGNCDAKGEAEIIEEINGNRVFLCHGHQYNVKSNLHTIFYRGKEIGADLVIFGHSHVPCYGKEEDMILLNPGSISEPRGGSKRSLAIVEIEEEIKVSFIEFE